MEEKKIYSLVALGFWQAYFIQMRPYLLFVSGAAGLSGIAAAYTPQVSEYRLLFSFIPLFLGYGFGQALTDCFQLDTDRISAPYRPLSRGIISVGLVKSISFLGLVFGVGLLIYLNLWNILPGALSVFGLATYTFFKRHFWFAGPVWNGWIVALLPLMGYISVTGENITENLKNVLPLMGLSFFSYMLFVIMGYLKDISADSATGYKTFPVIFGWNATVWVGDIFLIASVLISLKFIVDYSLNSWVWLIGTIFVLCGQSYAHFTKDKTEKNTAFAITSTVRAFVLWHMAIVLYYHMYWWPFVIIFYLLFEVALYLRPEQNQI